MMSMSSLDTFVLINQHPSVLAIIIFILALPVILFSVWAKDWRDKT